jgi:hypothetical protein
MAGRMAQVVEQLPSKYKVLSSNTGTTKNIYIYVYIWLKRFEASV